MKPGSFSNGAHAKSGQVRSLRSVSGSGFLTGKLQTARPQSRRTCSCAPPGRPRSLQPRVSTPRPGGACTIAHASALRPHVAAQLLITSGRCAYTWRVTKYSKLGCSASPRRLDRMRARRSTCETDHFRLVAVAIVPHLPLGGLLLRRRAASARGQKGSPYTRCGGEPREDVGRRGIRALASIRPLLRGGTNGGRWCRMEMTRGATTTTQRRTTCSPCGERGLSGYTYTAAEAPAAIGAASNLARVAQP